MSQQFHDIFTLWAWRDDFGGCYAVGGTIHSEHKDLEVFHVSEQRAHCPLYNQICNTLPIRFATDFRAFPGQGVQVRFGALIFDITWPELHQLARSLTEEVH
jgi:hypothetical protein